MTDDPALCSSRPHLGSLVWRDDLQRALLSAMHSKAVIVKINELPPMTVRRVRTPHGSGRDHNGWFTVTRGAKVPRRAIIGILLGTYRARIETCSTTDPDKWSFYGDKDTPFAEPPDEEGS